MQSSVYGAEREKMIDDTLCLASNYPLKRVLAVRMKSLHEAVQAVSVIPVQPLDANVVWLTAPSLLLPRIGGARHDQF